MIVAVTGATGFVGMYIADELEKKGYSVSRFGRKNERNLKNWDISKGLYKSNIRYDVVLHCAALVDDWSSYSDLFNANVIGTRNVVNSFSNAKNIIYISTGSIYSSKCDFEKINENQCVGGSTLSNYGKTKLLGEKEVAKSNIKSRVILRPHIIYGSEGNIVTRRIKDSIKNNTFFLPGNGKNYLCFTHIENLLHAIEQCIKKQPQGLNIYNIVDRDVGTIGSVLNSVKNLNNLDFKVKKIPKKIALVVGFILEFLYKSFKIKHPPRLTSYIVYQMTHNQILDITAAEKDFEYNPVKNYKKDFYLPK